MITKTRRVYTTNYYTLGFDTFSVSTEIPYLEFEGERYYNCSSLCSLFESVEKGTIIGNYLRYFTDDTFLGQQIRVFPWEAVLHENTTYRRRVRVQIVIDENWFELKDGLNLNLYQSFCGVYVPSFLYENFKTWVLNNIFHKLTDSSKDLKDH